MSATPLIKSLSTSGGSFYLFSSAVTQEQVAGTDDDLKFVYSKFVTLNLPTIKVPTYKENNIQFLSIDGQIYDGVSGYNSENLIQSFQNYCLNLESLIINSDSYDNSTLKTVSERVFFKWLKEIGAVRFREANDTEATNFKFTEEDTKLTGDQRYNKVVNYVGDIDIVNNVKHKGNSYTEVYLHIPSEVGSTPVVLFDSEEDDNYQPNMVITGDDENIYNRDLSTLHPDNLSISAYYDYDTNMDYIDSINANWYNQDPALGNTNSYFTEPVSFINPDNIEILKNSNDYSGATAFSTINYLRSQLDGIGIDFDLTSYTDIVNNTMLNSIQEYNSSAMADNFEFNAVLVYYDIYDEANPSEKKTNLYGILFLDNMIENLGESYIPSFQKYKFNDLTNKNGNSYGLRLNFRNNQSISGSNVETMVNDYNTFSMGLFSEAMVQLQNSVINFQEQNTQLIDLQTRLASLESLIYSVNDLTEVKLKLDDLEKTFKNAQIAFSESTVILDLIANVNNRLNQVLQNNTSIELQYNTDVIQAGVGVTLDKSVRDKFIINNSVQAYSIPFVRDADSALINEDNKYDLEVINPELVIITKPFSNYIKLHTLIDSELETHLKIVLNDKNSKFENGQLFRLSFTNNVNFNSYNIRIYSDYYDQHGYGELGKVIANINFSELSGKPLIDIICVDKTTYAFEYEIIR